MRPVCVDRRVVLMACQDHRASESISPRRGSRDGDILAGRHSGSAAAARRSTSISAAPSAGGFTTVSTNPYPLRRGGQWTYAGDGNSPDHGFDETRLIDGVTTRRDRRGESRRRRADRDLLELLRHAGDGRSATTERTSTSTKRKATSSPMVRGARRSGQCSRNHARDPSSGLRYLNELAPGIAEDKAKIVGTGTVTVPAGRSPRRSGAESSGLDTTTDSRRRRSTGSSRRSVELLSFTPAAGRPGHPPSRCRAAGPDRGASLTGRKQKSGERFPRSPDPVYLRWSETGGSSVTACRCRRASFRSSLSSDSRHRPTPGHTRCVAHVRLEAREVPVATHRRSRLTVR